MRPISLPLLVTLATGCQVYHPLSLYDQDRPMAKDYQVVAEVSAERCSSYLFGSLRMDDGFRMHELLDEARGDHDALVYITVDTLYRGGFLIRRRCLAVRAWAVEFADPRLVVTIGGRAIPGKTAAEEASPGERGGPPGGQASLDKTVLGTGEEDGGGSPRKVAAAVTRSPEDVEITASLAQLLDLSYRALGRPAPTARQDLQADAFALVVFMEQNHTPSEALSAIQAGAKVVGTGAPLADILAAAP